jgi:hypothetical protein
MAISRRAASPTRCCIIPIAAACKSERGPGADRIAGGCTRPLAYLRSPRSKRTCTSLPLRSGRKRDQSLVFVSHLRGAVQNVVMIGT